MGLFLIMLGSSSVRKGRRGGSCASFVLNTVLVVCSMVVNDRGVCLDMLLLLLVVVVLADKQDKSVRSMDTWRFLRGTREYELRGRERCELHVLVLVHVVESLVLL